MLADGVGELAQGFESALERGGYPLLQKVPRPPVRFVIPELVELVLQHPSPMNAAVALAQLIEYSGVGFGTLRGVPEQQPTQPAWSKNSCGLLIVGFDKTPSRFRRAMSV